MPQWSCEFRGKEKVICPVPDVVRTHAFWKGFLAPKPGADKAAGNSVSLLDAVRMWTVGNFWMRVKATPYLFRSDNIKVNQIQSDTKLCVGWGWQKGKTLRTLPTAFHQARQVLKWQHEGEDKGYQFGKNGVAGAQRTGAGACQGFTADSKLSSNFQIKSGFLQAQKAPGEELA